MQTCFIVVLSLSPPTPHPLLQMQNRMAILMCNLKPAKMRGVVSQAMVMCASSPDKVEILDPPSGAVPGDRITFQGFPGIASPRLASSSVGVLCRLDTRNCCNVFAVLFWRCKTKQQTCCNSYVCSFD